jgi:hypothetical protein
MTVADHNGAVTTDVLPRPATRDPIAEFFAGLAAPGHLATFEGQSATIRFDVARADPGHWYVTIDDGAVAVSQRTSEADAVITIERPQLEALVTGRLNAQAALLRGLFTCEGSISAAMMFQRCLPGPPGATGRVAPISSAAVTAQRRPE